MLAEGLTKVGFGGGCHWCTEAVFQALRGVSFVNQGFISSTTPNELYSEAVIVSYDSRTIDLRSLIEIHIRTHSSTSTHRLRDKYRSAVYYFSELQSTEATQALQEIQNDFTNKIITEVLPLVTFKESRRQYRNYYLQGQGKPFCKLYIDPKLDRIRAEFSHLV
ncbi:MAG: peptide-methionine (S)-S-oxide reductase [Patiriisocius sp.]|jgi:peptide-methionine (S)-S-oxide reductase